MENHAEIKDRCDSLETHMDEIASDIRHISFDYKIIDKYTNIDEEIHKIYEWYDGMKDIIKRYVQERAVIEKRLVDLEKRSKQLNNEVQNIKSQASFHVPL